MGLEIIPRGVEKCIFFLILNKSKMLRFLAFACVVAACAAQTKIDSKDAKILKEQRFNSGDGRTGSAFATEDGTIFREETDAEGNRVGQYSYIGDDGKVITVKYTAGKDGFRIIEGDHIQATEQDSAPFNPDFESPAPLDEQPRQVVRAQPVPQAAAAPVFNDYEEVEADPNRNPFINPHDPTHRDFAFNKNGADFQPKNPTPTTNTQQAQSQFVPLDQSFVPNCADCGGGNPFVNPFDASHGGNLAGHLAGHQAGVPFVPRQQVPALARVPQQPARPVILPAAVNNAERVFPPGQLTLSRFETGFNFDFES